MKFYDQITPKIPERIKEKHAHIIGSGIAGLAAAVYLVQDAKMPGRTSQSMKRAPIWAVVWKPSAAPRTAI